TGYRTPTKVRILAGAAHSIKQQVVRYDVEGELVLAAEDLEFLTAQLRRRARRWATTARCSATAAIGCSTSPASTARLPTRRKPTPFLASQSAAASATARRCNRAALGCASACAPASCW